MSPIDLILKERRRQISAEGFTAAHDDLYIREELALAAAVYCIPNWAIGEDDHVADAVVELWPWECDWLKRTPHDRLRELTKAGALIVAEMERLQRLVPMPAPVSGNADAQFPG